MSVTLNSHFIEHFLNGLRPEVRNTYQYDTYLKHIGKIENALIRGDFYGIIDRFHISGSMRKNSALYYKFDADIIIFFNCEGGCEQFIRRKHSFLNYIIDTVVIECSLSEKQWSKTENSFTFCIEELKFDILPAWNRLNNEDNAIIDMNRFFVQHNRIVDICHNWPEIPPATAMHELNTSYQELSDYFVFIQDGFTHYLILLCKHWCRNHLEVYFKGRSSTMELIAIHVASTLPEPKCLTQAFLHFLTICENIETCKIQFQPPFYRSEKFKLKIDPNNHLLDPVNPYENRLVKMRPYFSQISEIAKETKGKLERKFNNLSDARIEFDKIFRFSNFVDYYYDYNLYNLFLFTGPSQYYTYPILLNLNGTSQTFQPVNGNDRPLAAVTSKMQKLTIDDTNEQETPESAQVGSDFNTSSNYQILDNTNQTNEKYDLHSLSDDNGWTKKEKKSRKKK